MSYDTINNVGSESALAQIIDSRHGCSYVVRLL